MPFTEVSQTPTPTTTTTTSPQYDLTNAALTGFRYGGSSAGSTTTNNAYSNTLPGSNLWAGISDPTAAYPPAPTYSYTPAAIQSAPGLAALQNQNLYTNPSTPWYVPPAQPATQPMQPGWDNSAFMQGLRSLGYGGF